MADATSKPKNESNILTPVFRLSFPKVFKPERYEDDPNGKPMYSVTMLFDAAAQKSAEYAKMRAMAKAALVKKFGEKLPDHMKRRLKTPFRKCEEKPHLAGYLAGEIFVRASSDTKPQLLDQGKSKITLDGPNGDEPGVGMQILYPGCYCRAIVGAFGYDKKGNVGVSFGLRAVQKVREGDSLGGGGPVDHLLDELPYDDADDNFAPPAEGGDNFDDNDNDFGGDAAAGESNNEDFDL